MYAIIFIIIIVFYLITMGKTRENYENENQKIKLYSSMSVLHEIFKKHNIWYNIAFGTLLGAVRHREMIPWDDDIDLIVMYKDIEKLDMALKDVEQLGYRVDKSWKLYRIYSDKNCFIDIFFIDIENDKVIRTTTDTTKMSAPAKSETWWWDWFNFPSSYLGTPKKYEFSGLFLNGPSDPKNILKHWYGDDYLTMCQSQTLLNHGMSEDGTDLETVVYLSPKKEKCKDLPLPQFP